MPYAYATTDHRLSRDECLVAPLLSLTVLGTLPMVLLGWGWLVVPLAANAAGAVADVWMTLTLLGYPDHVVVRDHDDGVRILGREGDRVPSLPIASVAWDAVAGAAVATLGLFLVLGVAGPLTRSALGVDSLVVGRPGTVTYPFSFVDRPEEISFGVGPGVLIPGALLGLVYVLGRTYLRGRSIGGRAEDPG